jgi:hypothetical protein
VSALIATSETPNSTPAAVPSKRAWCWLRGPQPAR